MQRIRLVFCTYCLIGLLLAACTPPQNIPTPYATRTLSAPGIVPSATIPVFTSEELYGGTEQFSGGLGQSDLTAASLPSRGILPPDVVSTPDSANEEAQVVITLDDGTLLQADLYVPENVTAVDQVTNRPGVLLIAPDRVGWGLLPAQLQVAGLTALVVDVPATHEDLTTILTSLSEAPGVDPGRLGVIAAGNTIAPILTACAASEMCDALVLLSPADVVASDVTALNPRPFFLVAANTDAAAYPVALSLSTALTNATFREIAAGEGTGLLSNEGLNDEIANWLSEALAG